MYYSTLYKEFENNVLIFVLVLFVLLLLNDVFFGFSLYF
jgi:hypothetical protein